MFAVDAEAMVTVTQLANREADSNVGPLESILGPAAPPCHQVTGLVT